MHVHIADRNYIYCEEIWVGLELCLCIANRNYSYRNDV